MDQNLFNEIESVQNFLIDVATGGQFDESIYQDNRSKLLEIDEIKNYIPNFLRTNRSLKQFWTFIKNVDKTYEGRRQFLWTEFSKALEYAENKSISPAVATISKKVATVNLDYVNEEWQKALRRKDEDPAGAITSSRSLIETICKHILDDLGVVYDDKIELPKLYKLTAKQLNLSPEQHSESVFKQILGGCQMVVEGLGSLRNRLSDSHGKRARSIKPSKRHAELAVNLAGTMTVFLLETYLNNKNGA